MLRIELVMQVIDHLPAAVNLVVPGVSQVMHDIKLLGERLADILADVIHNGSVRYIIPLLYMQQWCLSFILYE